MENETPLINYVLRLLLVEVMLCYRQENGLGSRWMEDVVKGLEKQWNDL